MQDPLTRSENARLLAQYDRKAQQQVDNAQGVAAITGATPEYTLAVQKAVADGRADLMGGMASEASERRDKYEDKAETARHQKVLDDQERRAARNQTYANLAANAASAAGSIIDSYSPKSIGGDNTDVSQKAATSMASTIADAKKKLNIPT